MTAVRADENLPEARNRLDRAVYDLTHPRTDGQGHWAPSLYMQLRDSLAGEKGAGYNGAPQSQPPVWVDASMLLHEIDTAAEVWHPQLCGVPPTVGRLKALRDKAWRPQDARNIHQIASACEVWCKQITNLLDPERIKHFREPNGEGYAACPQCGRRTTYRTDPTDGESKRVPVLQWTAETGTTCIVCKAWWEPRKTLFVSQLLGFELPTGVLE